MGSGCSRIHVRVPSVLHFVSAAARSRRLENELEKTKEESINEVKLLLLGAGESGKSTIVKQMKIIHDSGFNESERLLYKAVVFSNIVQSMLAILRAMKSFNIDFEDEDTEHAGARFFEETEYDVQDNNYNGELKPVLVDLMTLLWQDKSVQASFSRANEYSLNDSAGYFLESLDRIGRPDYVPTEQDVLRTRVRTTGIVEIQFFYKGLTFRLFDVGGQRSERKKWIRCFDEVKAVIFIAALSDYDLTLAEDDNVNRLHESLKLFGSICNNRFFEQAAMILFLNKKDIFADKIKTRPITLCFPDYCGESNYLDTTAYIQTQFENLNQKTSKDVYTHLTCATDSNNIRFVFDVITDLLVRENLKSCGLF